MLGIFFNFANEIVIIFATRNDKKYEYEKVFRSLIECVCPECGGTG
jgi:hypothetical protein